MATPSIRLLAIGTNERGDLFTRLTKDLFFALGYDDPRINVHSSGREIDVQARHRLEPRRVLGECKAHEKAIGGADLNKFFGILSRERRKHEAESLVGYFVSLSGFSETAVEQELDTSGGGLILLGGPKIVIELENSRLLVNRPSAAERAGRCVSSAGYVDDLTLDGSELLAHDRGYIWAIYFSKGKDRTHFALIHADGTPLAVPIAKEIVEADRACGGVMSQLSYLAPPPATPDKVAAQRTALTRYRQWMSEECGYIQLDGLPADSVLSAVRMKLESLFVPLRATLERSPDNQADEPPSEEEPSQSIGHLLGRHSHLAILAVAGGGKSTLLKRLATAYAFPERRTKLSDDLPDRDWLPLMLRCRELRDRAHRPIMELLEDIPRHAGMADRESIAFKEETFDRLRVGKAILLIDGLDEISDEGDRQTFARNLRTFLAMFPHVAFVVSSRQAGFRLVAGVIASTCTLATLSALDENDVLSLSERWHIEVLEDTHKVRIEAQELGRAIWGDKQIRTLVENPLLLTTLFVVRRYIRELPRNRAALYSEAIRVLVRTWNVEGYAPLDESEALAQLSYVACQMMEEGKQRVDQSSLLKHLKSAHRELDIELQFSQISPQQFVERIEYRSSLLMQAGHDLVDGKLDPVYEFRHLTFQEYLAARGYVQEQYPGRAAGKSLADVLGVHFDDERWQQVVALAAVLAGRKAEELILRLVNVCKDNVRPPDNEAGRAERLLLLCIREEVQVSLPTLHAAFLILGRRMSGRALFAVADGMTDVLRGKFGEAYQNLIETTYLGSTHAIHEYCSALARIADFKYLGEGLTRKSQGVILELLRSSQRGERIHGALCCMSLAYLEWGQVKRATNQGFRALFAPFTLELEKLLGFDDLHTSIVASWALAWTGQQELSSDDRVAEVLLKTFKVWRASESLVDIHFPPWALSAQKLLPRNMIGTAAWGDCDQFLRHAASSSEGSKYHAWGAATVGWYRRSPWTDDELVQIISGIATEKEAHLPVEHIGLRLLQELGTKGLQLRKLILDRQSKRTQRSAKAQTKRSQAGTRFRKV